VNANSQTAKATDVIIGTHAPRDSPDMKPEKVFEMAAWPWSRDCKSVTLSVVLATDTNFKFGTLALRDSPDMFPDFFRNVYVAMVT